MYVCIFICTKQRTTSLFLFVNNNNNFVLMQKKQTPEIKVYFRFADLNLLTDC